MKEESPEEKSGLRGSRKRQLVQCGLDSVANQHIIGPGRVEGYLDP